MKKIVYSFAIFATMTSVSFANSGSIPSEGEIDRVLHGHGTPGDVVVPSSNGDVSYKVLESGTVQKINRRYNTMEIVRSHRPGSTTERPSWVGR